MTTELTEAPAPNTPASPAITPAMRALSTRVLSAITGHRIAVQERTRYLEGAHKPTAEREQQKIDEQRKAEARLIRAIRDVARPELEELLRSDLEALL
jgi:hypothetical protein